MTTTPTDPKTDRDEGGQSALEQVRAEVRRQLAERTETKDGKTRYDAFACICGNEGKKRESLYSVAISEWVGHNLKDWRDPLPYERDRFTTHVAYLLLQEGFYISIDADQWCSVSARSTDHPTEYFYMQCDVIDHGFLFLALAFEDWLATRPQSAD